MADIIQFKPREKQTESPSGEHILELHVYDHGGVSLSGVCRSDVYDYGTPEDRIEIAEILERMAWLVRKECAEVDAERGDLMAVAYIYAAGSVRVRVDDDKVRTDAQLGWLDRMLDNAKIVARPE